MLSVQHGNKYMQRSKKRPGRLIGDVCTGIWGEDVPDHSRDTKSRMLEIYSLEKQLDFVPENHSEQQEKSMDS
jgi:hypothetical protein